MSDSLHDEGTNDRVDPNAVSNFDYPPSGQAGEPVAMQIDWCRFASWLSRLGTVLWLCRAEGDSTFPRARLACGGVLLLDHPALAAFSNSASVEAHSAITVEGPREWLEFLDAKPVCIARLYLLPDADYLAWDAMLGDCRIARAPQQTPARWRAHAAFMRCALRRLHSSWQARAVRFPLLRLPCLHVLGLRAPAAVSELGRQLAVSIADDERAVLQAAAV